MEGNPFRWLLRICQLWIFSAVGVVTAHAQFLAYVSNYIDNTVSVLATANNSIVATIPVGSGPWGVVATPNGGYVYVANMNDGTVSVISTATNTVLGTIPVGAGPAGIAVTPNGAFVYVANSGASSIFVISTSANAVVATIPLSFSPTEVTISPNGAFAYAVGSGKTSMAVINTATNMVEATPTLPAPDDGPPVFSSTGATCYIPLFYGYVAVMNTVTNSVSTTWSYNGGAPGIDLNDEAVTLDGSTVYMTAGGFNSVLVISASTGTVTTQIPVTGYPWGVAMSPDGSLLLTANYTGGTVSMIQTSTNTVTATVNVGKVPTHIVLVAFDNDSEFAQLSGGNSLSGNQNVNGTVSATNFTGNGASLTNLNPANLSGGTAIINIAGNAATATSAINASNAVNAINAGNAADLGGVPATSYARLDVSNSFGGNQSVSGNIAASGSISASGSLSIGGGTPISQYVSATYAVSLPPLKPQACTYFFESAAVGSGLNDTVALGIPEQFMLVGGFMMFQAWESGQDTLTIRVCNMDPNGPGSQGVTGIIRVDLFKH